MKSKPSILGMILGVLLAISCTDMATTYDIVINNGRVMDPETNFDAIRNVGVKDGKIAKITKRKIKGKETIDASGHVVAPGFISPHTHAVTQYGQHLMIQDGTTTALDLEYGALDLPKFYDQMKGQSFLNHGVGVSHEAARIAIMDNYIYDKGTDGRYVHAARTKPATQNWRERLPTEEELEKIFALLEE